MSAEIVIVLMVLFVIKHFICDFLFQTPYMLANKGTYGHDGGILHAAVHGLGTCVVIVLLFAVLTEFSFACIVFGIVLGLLDGVIHYHIDFLKVKYSNGLTPADHDFWVLLGADQALHMITYLILIAALL